MHSCSGASHWTELHPLQPASAYDLRVVAVNAIGREGARKFIVSFLELI